MVLCGFAILGINVDTTTFIIAVAVGGGIALFIIVSIGAIFFCVFYRMRHSRKERVSDREPMLRVELEEFALTEPALDGEIEFTKLDDEFTRLDDEIEDFTTTKAALHEEDEELNMISNIDDY